MGIKTDRSGTPRATKPAGREPDAQARFGPLLAQRWHQEYLAEGNDFRPMAFDGARWRHSWAAECARKLHYRLAEAKALRDAAAGLAEWWAQGIWPLQRLADVIHEFEVVRAKYMATEPLSVADHWRFGIGTAVHDMLQAVVLATFPEAEAEVTVRSGDLGAGHIDLVVRLPRENPTLDERPEYVIAIEIKTINGFGFKRMIGDRSAPEGPRFSSVVQLALNASALEADEAVLLVLSAENLSPASLRSLLGRLHVDDDGQDWRRFIAEYTFTRDEFEPLAAGERKRMARIIELTDQDKLVPRSIPDPEIPTKARITDPRKGLWELVDADGTLLATGSTWHCDYCENRTRCIADGAS